MAETSLKSVAELVLWPKRHVPTDTPLPQSKGVLNIDIDDSYSTY
jgi:hypothetical protein